MPNDVVEQVPVSIGLGLLRKRYPEYAQVPDEKLFTEVAAAHPMMLEDLDTRSFPKIDQKTYIQKVKSYFPEYESVPDDKLFAAVTTKFPKVKFVVPGAPDLPTDQTFDVSGAGDMVKAAPGAVLEGLKKLMGWMVPGDEGAAVPAVNEPIVKDGFSRVAPIEGLGKTVLGNGRNEPAGVTFRDAKAPLPVDEVAAKLRGEPGFDMLSSGIEGKQPNVIDYVEPTTGKTIKVRLFNDRERAIVDELEQQQQRDKPWTIKEETVRALQSVRRYFDDVNENPNAALVGTTERKLAFNELSRDIAAAIKAGRPVDPELAKQYELELWKQKIEAGQNNRGALVGNILAQQPLWMAKIAAIVPSLGLNLLPDVAAGAMDRATPQIGIEDGKFTAEEQSVPKAIYDSTMNTAIEAGTEILGGKGLSKLGDATVMAAAKRSKELKALLLAREIKRLAEGGAEAGSIKKLLKDVEWHGIVPEIGEEAMASQLHAAAMDSSMKDEKGNEIWNPLTRQVVAGKQFAEQFPEMAVAFGLMGGAGHVAQTGEKLANRGMEKERIAEIEQQAAEAGSLRDVRDAQNESRYKTWQDETKARLGALGMEPQGIDRILKEPDPLMRRQLFVDWMRAEKQMPAASLPLGDAKNIDVPVAGKGAGVDAPSPAATEPQPVLDGKNGTDKTDGTDIQPVEGARAFRVKSGQDRSKTAEGYWAVVDLGDLRGGEGLQERDRGRVGSANQAREIYSQFDPEELGDAPTAATGSIVVDRQGRVIAGYGRKNVLGMVYDNPGPQQEAYREFLGRMAEEKGVAGQIEGKQRPVLVRVAARFNNTTPEELARQSNAAVTLGFSATENALRDAKLITDGGLIEALQPDETGDLRAASNRPFMQAFLRKLPANEHGTLLDADGSPSAAFETRMKKAVLTALVAEHPDSVKTVQELMENAEGYGVGNLVNGLTAAAPGILKAGDLDSRFDLRQDISTAMPHILEAKKLVKAGKAKDIEGYFAQSDMFRKATPEVEELSKILLGARSAKALRTILGLYAEKARKLAVDSKTQDMFAGELPTTDKLGLLKQVQGEVNGQADGQTNARGATGGIAAGPADVRDGGGVGGAGSGGVRGDVEKPGARQGSVVADTTGPGSGFVPRGTTPGLDAEKRLKSREERAKAIADQAAKELDDLLNGDVKYDVEGKTVYPETGAEETNRDSLLADQRRDAYLRDARRVTEDAIESAREARTEKVKSGETDVFAGVEFDENFAGKGEFEHYFEEFKRVGLNLCPVKDASFRGVQHGQNIFFNTAHYQEFETVLDHETFHYLIRQGDAEARKLLEMIDVSSPVGRAYRDYLKAKYGAKGLGELTAMAVREEIAAKLFADDGAFEMGGRELDLLKSVKSGKAFEDLRGRILDGLDEKLDEVRPTDGTDKTDRTDRKIEDSRFRMMLRGMAGVEVRVTGSAESLAARESAKRAREILAQMDAGAISEKQAIVEWNRTEEKGRKFLKEQQERRQRTTEAVQTDMFAEPKAGQQELMFDAGQGKMVPAKSAQNGDVSYDSGKASEQGSRDSAGTGEDRNSADKESERNQLLLQARRSTERAIEKARETDARSVDGRGNGIWSAAQFDAEYAAGNPEFLKYQEQFKRLGLNLLPVLNVPFEGAQYGEDIFFNTANATPQKLLEAVRHELFHHLVSSGDERALALIKVIDTSVPEYRTFGKWLLSEYEKKGLGTLKTSDLNEEIAANLFSSKTIFEIEGKSFYLGRVVPDMRPFLKIQEEILRNATGGSQTSSVVNPERSAVSGPRVQEDMPAQSASGNSSQNRKDMVGESEGEVKFDVGDDKIDRNDAIVRKAAEVAAGRLYADKATSADERAVRAVLGVLADKLSADILGRVVEETNRKLKSQVLDLKLGMEENLDNANRNTRGLEDVKPGSGQADAGADRAGSGGSGRRTDLRVIAQGDLPEPRNYVGVGSYDIDEDQRFGVNAALTRFLSGGRGFLLADGTGVGKTSQILVIAHEFQKRTGKPVLIVTQNVQIIKGSFLDDATRMKFSLDNFELATYDSIRGQNPTALTNIRQGVKETRVSIKDKNYGLVLFDEAHNLKNGDSQKTIRGLKLAANAEHTLYATATPMDTATGAAYFMSEVTGVDRNEMAEMLGFEFKEIKEKDGTIREQAVLKKNSTWVDVLKNILALRREAVKLGAIVRREYPFLGTFETEDLPFDAKAKAEEARIKKYFDEHVKSTRNPTARKMWSGQITLALCNWLEPQKIPWVKDRIRKSLAEGHAVVVVAANVNDSDRLAEPEKDYRKMIWHKVFGVTGAPKIEGTLNSLAEWLKSEGIEFAEVFGRGKKDEEISAFQKGNARVVLMTSKSGGTGVNLDDVAGDRPRDMIIMSTDFAGDQFQQTLGRVSRRNTASQSRVFFPMIPDSFADGRRAEILKRKLDVLGRIQQGADVDAAGFSGEEQTKPKENEQDGEVQANVAQAASEAGKLPRPGYEEKGFDAADDNRLVIELPELTALATEMMKGRFPELKRALRAGRGMASGVFRPRMNGEIELRTDLFDPITTEQKKMILEEAKILHQQEKEQLEGTDEKPRAIARYYNDLLKEAYRTGEIELPEIGEHLTGLDTPMHARYVLAHEVGHLRDWLPDHEMKRGNVLGHMAGLQDYMKSLLSKLPTGDILTEEEIKAIRSEAGKEARRTKGDEATIYKRLKREAIEQGGMVTKEMILGELKALTQWWSPFDETADEKYTEYRHSAVELYADMFSVLINNPAALHKRAPLTWDLFQNWRQDDGFERRYKMVLDEIRNGKTLETLDKRILDGFRQGEVKLTEGREKRKEGRVGDFWNAFRIGLFDKAAVLLSKINKFEKTNGLLDPALNPRYAIEDQLYIGATMEVYMRELSREVVDVLENGKLTAEDLGLYLFYRRVSGERYAMGNPFGTDPKRARERLAKYVEADRKILEKAAAALERIRNKYILGPMAKANMWSSALMDYAKANDSYATFGVVEYLDGEYGTGIGSRVYRQYGTLKAIMNPLTATVLKDMSLISAMAANVAKRSAIGFLVEHGQRDQDWKPAEMKWNGKTRVPVEPGDRNWRLLAYLENGRMKGVYVPKALAAQWEQENAWVLQVLTRFANNVSTPIRSLFTDANPGFWMSQGFMDIMAAVNHLPGNATLVGRKAYLPHFFKALKPAFKSVFGNPDKIVEDMLKNKMLISMINRGQGGYDTDMELERWLAAAGVDRLEKELFRPLAMFGMAWDKWTGIAQGLDRAKAIAVKTWLDRNSPGMSEAEKAHFVRSAANPAFLRRGSLYPLYNNIWWFANAAKEGWRTEGESAKRDRWTWGWKMFKYMILPKTLVWGIRAGLVGVGVKVALMSIGGDDKKPVKSLTLEQIYKLIPEYDLANYHCVPVGQTPQGKIVYLRIPLSESGRFMGGVIWKMLEAGRGKPGGVPAVMDYGAGAAPNMNALITQLNEVQQVVAGHNPWDDFRSKPVFDQTMFDAGGTQLLQAEAARTWNNLGGAILMRFDTEDVKGIQTQLEKNLHLPGLSTTVGRFLKVSDRGITEAAQEVKAPVKQQEARDLLAAREILSKLANGEKLQDADWNVFSKKIDYILQEFPQIMGAKYGDRWVRELIEAPTKEQREAVYAEMLRWAEKAGK